MRSTVDCGGRSTATSVSRTEVPPLACMPRYTTNSWSSRSFSNEYDERSVTSVASGVHSHARWPGPAPDVPSTAGLKVILYFGRNETHPSQHKEPEPGSTIRPSSALKNVPDPAAFA